MNPIRHRSASIRPKFRQIQCDMPIEGFTPTIVSGIYQSIPGTRIAGQARIFSGSFSDHDSSEDGLDVETRVLGVLAFSPSLVNGQ